jgi:hypothetical protein
LHRENIPGYTERIKTKVRGKDGAMIPGGKDGKGARSQRIRQQIIVSLFKYIPYALIKKKLNFPHM